MIEITTFTDPMMGLSYECEPIFRKLETHFAGRIKFHYRMGLLVRNVYDFVNPEDMADGKDVAISRYLKRLAAIYMQEEPIMGMPINMSNLQLFSVDRTSTLPLDLAFHAARLTDASKAEEFLYRLRYATIVDCLQTTRYDEIMKVVESVGIDKAAFEEYYHNGAAENALKEDLAMLSSFGLHTLPAYIVTVDGKSVLVNQLIGYDAFVQIIDSLGNGKEKPGKVVADANAVRQLMKRHPLISTIEIREALDLKSDKVAVNLVAPLLASGELKKNARGFLSLY